MNINIIKRLYRRLRYMDDSIPYKNFLEHISEYHDVWKVPQCEVAQWWEKRQTAKIEFEFSKDSVLTIKCNLPNSVIEVGGKELKIPPFQIETNSNTPIGKLDFTYSCKENYLELANEIFAHFGYGHFKKIDGSNNADIPSNILTPLLESMHSTAIKHWRYENDEIEKFRSLVKEVHNKKGLPDLRIWPLPHNNGIPYRACVSTRYDVDKAIMLMPEINELEAKYGLKSTAYIRPIGYFYGESEIIDYVKHSNISEIALHGEFVTTAERFKKDEFYSAKREKEILENMINREVEGVCMHGGELHSNATSNTKKAIELAGFKYETLYSSGYYHPFHLPLSKNISKTLSITRHTADISIPLTNQFKDIFLKELIDKFSTAYNIGGIFVPIMHPLYFGISKYLLNVKNMYMIARFTPKFISSIIKMRANQLFINVKNE